MNLSDGHYGKVDSRARARAGQSDGATAEGGATSSDAALGTLPEEAAVRDIITNVLTDQTGATLINAGRERSSSTRSCSRSAADTDVKLTDVLFTDVAVQ